MSPSLYLQLLVIKEIISKQTVGLGQLVKLETRP
jgi:hypothetical protein